MGLLLPQELEQEELSPGGLSVSQHRPSGVPENEPPGRDLQDEELDENPYGVSGRGAHLEETLNRKP